MESREEGSGDSEAGTGEEKTRGGAAIGDDYRFLYMGAAPGTWTAMHDDVLLSYSWSLNLEGCIRQRAAGAFIRHLRIRGQCF